MFEYCLSRVKVQILPQNRAKKMIIRYQNEKFVKRSCQKPFAKETSKLMVMRCSRDASVTRLPSLGNFANLSSYDFNCFEVMFRQASKSSPPSLPGLNRVNLKTRFIHNRLRAVSLLMRNRRTVGGEATIGKQRECKPQRKVRLQWFHTELVMHGTVVL